VRIRATNTANSLKITPIAAAGSKVPAVANSIMSKESGRVCDPASSADISQRADENKSKNAYQQRRDQRHEMI